MMGSVYDAVVEWTLGPSYEGKGYRILLNVCYADPRTKDWPLMDVRQAIFITAMYLIGIVLGTRAMRNCRPFKIKGVVALHNLILFLLSVYMCVETCRQAYIEFEWDHSLNILSPQLKTGPFSPAAKRLATVLWVHYISKAYEFVDTFIMILKKNTRQISFLHIYHHATTFFPVWWSVIMYCPGGAAYLCCAINSFIHIWMYGYYMLAGLGIKSTAVKPLITYGQMVQFLILIAQGLYILATDCFRPRLTPILLVVQCFAFFILFAHFAYNTYWKPKQKI